MRHGEPFKLALGVLGAVAVALFAPAGEVSTQPWLQNVYTNRFTVMCETKGEMPGLALKYGEGFAGTVTMSGMNGIRAGTRLYTARVAGCPVAGATIPYCLATNGVAIAGSEGSVRLWKDGDAAFACAIWGDNQEGVHGYDWGFDDTDERYRCIRAMFNHMRTQKPDFGFTTGDMSSNALYDEEIEPGDLRAAADLFGNKIPYHLVWGNHDCNGTFFGEVYTNAAQRYCSPAATEEDGWFYVYRSDVLFIGVHWTWGSDDAEERYGQIAKEIGDLLATARAKNAKFRILLQHAPVFLECYNVLPKLNWFSDTRLLDVAKAGGVDVVFSGHTHAYERIERDGLVQITNGGMGYLDHGERGYNNYGSDTKVGGHQNTPYLWARQSPAAPGARHSVLGAAEPVRMGCFQGYGLLSVTNDVLTYRAHAFNADGSYVGVCDSFALRSKTVRCPVKPTRPESVSIGLDLGRPIDNAAWGEYKRAIGETFAYDAFHAHDPVVNVSKTEIEAFCAALNAGGAHKYRLPTAKELATIFKGNLRRDVSEWTADLDPDTGWCRILGGNTNAVDCTWCRPYDKPAMASPDCHANYLGFRLVDGDLPVAETSEMDKALAALAQAENPAGVYEWMPGLGMLKDITSDWTDAKLVAKYTYENPVIFAGKGDLTHRVRREVVFGGGVAAPNATRLNLSHVLELGPVSKPVTVRGEFRGGVSTNEWCFMLRCDELTLEGVTYRGQVFNVVTDSRRLNLVGENDFSGAVMSICSDRALAEPREDFVNRLVADGAATLRLRRLDFSDRGVVEEVLGQDAPSFTVGRNVTLTTAEDVLFGVDGSTLTVDGTLDAAGIDLEGHLMGLLPEAATVGGSGAVRTTHFGMCDKSTLYVDATNVTLMSSVPYRTYTACTNGCNVVYRAPRRPDYAAADGRDWLFNHAIAGKGCPDEAAADSGVDLFCVYPTLVGDERIVVDGFRGIDDATMRGAATNFQTAVGAYCGTTRCFADMTRVYAPYYRQATLDTATDCATNASGEVVADANANYLKKLREGPAYADVTNALAVYFAKWNDNRPFVLAAHSQGSAILRLLLEDYFALPENRAKAERLVCSYQIGFGLGRASMSEITAATGVKFAERSDDTNVVVSYNTMGGGSSGNSVLLEAGTLAINPISWSRGADLAGKELNLGALTNALGAADAVLPDLYGAQVVDTGASRGQVVVCAELDDEVLPPSIFGTGSLHPQDYAAFWEDLHKNCYDRITAATGKAPVVGRPTDYGDAGNWMSYPETADKPLDVFYLYPTAVPGACRALIGEIGDEMKSTAWEHYRKGPSTFEPYANVYAPFYRQGSAVAIVSDFSADGIQRFGARHVVKTDVFAALDYYFANRNPGATRPFVLASHSQGSANMKNVFEEYFAGEKASYTNSLVAAYVLGYKITPSWCEKVGIPFATGEADAGVVLTWNAEGPGATGDNFLTSDPEQLAINPLNWKTDETAAERADNLGSVITNAFGELYDTGKPGATGAHLQPGRAGAVIVDAPEAIPVGVSPGFGTKSYHFEDWGFFHDNIGLNGYRRYLTKTGKAISLGGDLVAGVEDGTCVINGRGELTDTSALIELEKAITNLVIQSGVTGIGERTFESWSNLLNAVVGANVVRLGDYAFYRCPALKNLVFVGSLPDVGEQSVTLAAVIRMENGKPIVTPVPEVTVKGDPIALKGKIRLEDEEWTTVPREDTGGCRFFMFEAK